MEICLFATVNYFIVAIIFSILNMRFFDGKTQMEVADEIGISQAQVSRVGKNALKHMRKYL